MRTITLKKPIKIGTEEITFFNIPEILIARQFENVEVDSISEVSNQIQLISDIFSHPRPYIEMMKASDLFILGQAIIKPFFDEIKDLDRTELDKNTYKLKHPDLFCGGEYAEVKIPEQILAKHYGDTDLGNLQFGRSQISLVANILGKKYEEVRCMAMIDMRLIFTIVQRKVDLEVDSQLNGSI